MTVQVANLTAALVKSARADFGKGTLTINIEATLTPEALALRPQLMQFIGESTFVEVTIESWQPSLLDEETGELI